MKDMKVGFSGLKRMFTILPVLALGSWFLTLSPAYAQSKPGSSKIVVVVGKPLTEKDSEVVRQLFFSALQEKTF
jgi:hypothetical protein